MTITCYVSPKEGRPIRYIGGGLYSETPKPIDQSGAGPIFELVGEICGHYFKPCIGRTRLTCVDFAPLGELEILPCEESEAAGGRYYTLVLDRDR